METGSEVAEELAVIKAHRKKWPWIIVITSLILIIMLVSAGFWVLSQCSQNPIPKSIRQSVSFGVYYPASLPPGWTLDKNSFTESSQLVTYKVRNKATSLTVSIQPKPQGLNIAEITKKLVDSTQFVTPLGEGNVGTSGDQRVGSLVSTSAWIVIVTPKSNASSDTIRQILVDLKQ